MDLTARPGALARRARHPSREHWLSRSIIVGLAIVAGLWLLPIIYMADVSLRLPGDAFDPSIVLPTATTVNYQTIFRDTPLPKYFMNSIVVSVATTLLVAAGSTLFAFGVSVLRVRFSRLVYAGILITLMVPIAALVVPVTQELKGLGLLNSYLGLIGPYTALGIPFATVILVSVMDDIPLELHEAAIMDGANSWQLLIDIVIPVIRPSLVFILIWQLITSWNEFFLALTVMTDGEMKTLALIPQQYSGVYLASPGALFAILTLVALPLIFMYLLVQHWFIAGLLEGSVKG
jgi:raffinose/stachyose/melibiose transport system permease protein